MISVGNFCYYFFSRDISDNRFTTFLPNILSLLTNLQKL